MGKIIFVTGGARSGKSRFAENILENKKKVLYIATAIAFDDEMKERIRLHRQQRNSTWKTLEAYRDFENILPRALKGMSAVMLDCITVMLTNIMLADHTINWDNISPAQAAGVENEIMKEAGQLMKILADYEGEAVIVSNELGMGLVPPTPMGRYFRDTAGRVNQMIAAQADEVYLAVSGIPVKVK